MRTLAVCLFSALLTISASAADSATLDIRKVKVRFRAAADSVRLTAEFPSEAVPDDYGIEKDGLELLVGGEVILSLPPVDDRSRLQWKWGRLFTYREKKSPDRGGVRKFRIDLRLGKLSVTAKKLDLDGLQGDGPTEVPFVLRLGDAEMTSTVTLVEKGGSWKYTAQGKFTPPDILREPEPVPESIFKPIPWRQLYRGSIALKFERSIHIITDQATYEHVWFNRLVSPYGGQQPPYVDFSKETAVAIVFGPAWAFNVKIHQVFGVGNYAEIHYTDWDGPTQYGTWNPWTLIAIPRTGVLVKVVNGL